MMNFMAVLEIQQFRHAKGLFKFCLEQNPKNIEENLCSAGYDQNSSDSLNSLLKQKMFSQSQVFVDLLGVSRGPQDYCYKISV
ncbi:hypothetical protein M0813_15087 [Anaeramoeba flamelloides]|uniref:Uncharacterized protein n=1 Tax=Anaeramoeba flamelloides TaxID=1746091 RepID=A0ABQ8Z3Q5_9EUKA|nr:hypothetical protein M0813_15087 [Anaeramoeba flamelloides]